MKLKSKLILLNAAVTFFIGTMLFLQFRSAQNKQKYEIRKGFAQSSEKLQRSISNVFYLYYHNVQNIALNKSLQSKNFDDANFYFNELVSLYPLYDLIVFTDTNGNYIASNSLDSTGKKINTANIKSFDLKGEAWFKALKEGNLVEDYKKKIYGSYFGEFEKSNLVKAAYGADRLGNHFSTQVNDEFGDPIGYITTFLNEKWIVTELMTSNAGLEKEGKLGADIYVFNKKGLVVSEVKGGKPVLDTQLSLDGTNKYKNEIERSKNLIVPSFVESMFAMDNSELVAYSDFDNSKFINTIGWKAFVKMESDSAFSSISVASNIFTGSFFVILIIGTFIGGIVSNRLSDRLLAIANKIADGSLNITDASGQLSEHSSNLSTATSEQASSLQQTVASLNEISAMVDKNTDASQGSKELSEKSRTAAETGKGTIDKMMSSIDEISDANSEIIDQMSQNAQEIQEIITVIKEIEDKTKVINDIVFQTKLLSFNASVEAARAGEHGKGFSVVAEEVGNLAQHSGDAAKQIEEMLIQSVNKVEGIAKNTAAKVSDLIEKGTTKVEQGKGVARQCDTALGEILEYANSLDRMIEEVATASIEQSQGLQEINKAMSELDKVTKQNSIIAHETSLNTQGLNNQAENLKGISIMLTDLITGSKSSNGATIELTRKEVKEDKKSVDLDLDSDNTPASSSSWRHSAAVSEGTPVEDSHESTENVVQMDTVKEQREQEKPASKAPPAKKVASSDIAVPSGDDGEWEDI